MRSKGEKPEKTMKIFPNFRPGGSKKRKDTGSCESQVSARRTRKSEIAVEKKNATRKMSLKRSWS